MKTDHLISRNIKTNRRFNIQFNSKIIVFIFSVLCSAMNVSGQTLKKMTPQVYSEWNKIKNIKLSDSAEVIIYLLEREIGDKSVCIYHKNADTTFTFSRVNKAETDISGQYVVFTRSLSYDSTRILKRKKTAKDKMPVDSLCIFNTATQSLYTIAGVIDFTLPSKYTGILVYTIKLETTKSDSTENEKKKKEICDVTAIIVRNLASGVEDTIKNAKEFVLADEAPILAYTQCSGDSLSSYSVFIFDLTKDSIHLVLPDMQQITQLSLEKRANHLAFLGLKEKSVSIQKPFDLYLKGAKDTLAVKITAKDSVYKPAQWVNSSDQMITFSESGNRLFFGIAPIRPVKDTTRLEDEIVNVEIWHHDSPQLYTQMETSLENDKKKSYAVMYDLGKNTFDVLETLDADRSLLSVKGDGRYFLQLKTMPYQKAVTWNGELLKDLILFDTETRASTQITTGESGNPLFSPTGRYLYWFSTPDSIWKTFDIQKSNISILGLWSVTKFHDEENDVPDHAGPYGIAGWLKNDEAAIVYDRYDMWKLYPGDPFTNVALTNGRESKTVHRWLDTDDENDFIDPDKNMIIHQFNEKTKAESYIRYDIRSENSVHLTGGDYALNKNIIKAKKTNHFIFKKQDFNTFPDLLLADSTFTAVKKISDANPQQSEYAWGSCEPYTWTNYSGHVNDGMLFFPPDFSPENKYPLIINFYERSSNELHRHRAPEAHRSTINYTYYTNQGYVVFNPDIKYIKGQPGEDCYIAVNSGVDALLKKGYIDSTRMGLQGHSWGGYQIAYLLTKTDRFKCAEAGAPVVNMVSAYGGVRWESGMSRMFQYEKQQSRIGQTLWENPAQYHYNSPIYQMEKVTTPVLIMHNDEDGAVPWEQGIEYYMALRRLGKQAWLLNYNGEPHWPVKWQNRLDFNIRMEQYFNHFLMDVPMPLWMKEGNTPLEKGILDKY